MQPFNSLNSFFQKKFGCRVYKVSVDAGFTCPNRDGTKGLGGCIFCDESGSSSRTQRLETPIKEQVQKNIEVRKSRYKAKKFIVYFQSKTNTYASIPHLKKLYDEAINAHEDIVGLAISTRADCVDEEKISFIASYKEKLPYVSIEYGMQSAHDETLKILNRKETHEDFVKAIKLTQKYQLHHTAHVILGLPGEEKKHIQQTAKRITELNVEGVKIHLLAALKNTQLANLYLNQKWKPLSLEEYVEYVCDFLERVPPEAIIHRVSGSGHPLSIIAPTWMKNSKEIVQDLVVKEFTKRKTRQGILSPILS